MSTKKEVQYQGLIDLNVAVNDVSSNSPDYFRVTQLPSEFNAGPNVIKFKGRPELFPENSPIYIEILDANGVPVYYETSLDLESTEKFGIINVYINQDTAPGNGYIIICGTANSTPTGIALDTSSINVRWIAPIYIDPSKGNYGEIVFAQLPEVTISASTSSYTNFGYPGAARFVSQSLENLEYYYYNQIPVLITSSRATIGFDSSSLSATVIIPYSSMSLSEPPMPRQVSTSSVYTGSIIGYNGAGVAFLADPIKFDFPSDYSYYLPTAAAVTASIVYEQSSSLPPQLTENSFNVATCTFSGLRPVAGTIDKIRSYYKSSGVSEYIFSNETDITDVSPEFGFNADSIQLNFAFPTVARFDRIDFKFEFVNPAGIISRQVLESKNHLFIGGNTYISGDDNLITGSLFVASQTGTGVQITGRNNSAMVTSIGYRGFANATANPQVGTAGFVIYSGSIQPLLQSSEVYSGVGIEMVANRDSYFKYTTSGSGLLDVRTNSFFLGSRSNFISGSNGFIEIYSESSSFHVNRSGQVTASAFIAKTGSTNIFTSGYEMLNTETGLVDGANVGRQLYNDPGLIVNTSGTATTPLSTFAEFTTFVLPFENVIYAYYNIGVSGSASVQSTVRVSGTVTNLDTGSFANLGTVGSNIVGPIGNTIVTVPGNPIQLKSPAQVKLILPAGTNTKLVRIKLEHQIFSYAGPGTVSYKISDLSVHVTRDIFNSVAPPEPAPSNPSS